MTFPVAPTNGQSATVNGIRYIYNSTDNAWYRQASPVANLTVSGNIVTGKLYTQDGLFWAGNGQVIVTGGGGGGGLTFTADTAPPTSGNISGDQWYNTTTDILYEYINDGTTSYWIDTQSLGQVGNITTIADATLQGNLVVGLGNVYSIGASNGFVKNIFSHSITANIVTVQGNITAANVTTSGNIQASFVHGDGSKLTNLNAASTGKAIAMSIVFGG
jgi:hypothetical protein